MTDGEAILTQVDVSINWVKLARAGSIKGFVTVDLLFKQTPTTYSTLEPSKNPGYRHLTQATQHTKE